MPKKTSKGFASRLKPSAKKQLKNHWNDEPELGFVDPPPGIRNGVAKLVECKFDTYKTGPNEGKYYFRAAGVIIEPKSQDGVTAAGRQTSIRTPVEDGIRWSGRESQEEHVLWVFNELKKLGVDVDEHEPEDLEELAANLKEAAPYFEFRTRASGDRGQYLNQDWDGILPDYEPTEDDEEEEETETENEESEEDEEEVDETETEEDDESEEPEEEEAEEDLAVLAELADEGDTEAVEKIIALAEAAGLSEEFYTEADSWGEVVAKLDEGAGDEEEEEIVPSKGETYFYKPKGARKAITCEVTTVAKAKQTCSLKAAKTGKSYRAVPWSVLSTE